MLTRGYAKKVIAFVCMLALMATTMLVSAAETQYQILDRVEYDGYTWETWEHVGYGDGSPLMEDGRREVQWNDNAAHTTIVDGIHTIEHNGNHVPATYTKIGKGLQTADIKYIELRVRVSTATKIKVLYSTKEDGSDFGETQAFTTNETIPADGNWHTAKILTNSGPWTDTQGLVLDQCRFQAEHSPSKWEIDWIRYMGEDEGLLETTPENGATGVALETTVTVSTKDLDIDSAALAALGSSAVTVSGGVATVGEIMFNVLDDPTVYSFKLSGLSPQTLYTVTVKAPVEGKTLEKVFNFTTISKYEVLDSLEFEGYTWDYWGEGAASPYIDFNRREVEWNSGTQHSTIADGIHTLVANPNASGTGFNQTAMFTNIGSGLYTKDIKHIQMRVRVSSSTASYMKLYHRCTNFPNNYYEGDGRGSGTLLSDTKIQGDGKWHIVTMTPTYDGWVNDPNNILIQCWFQAGGNPAVWEIDWIRFMGEGTAKQITYEDAGTGTIVKYDNSEDISFANNNETVNPNVSYDAENKAIKCSGTTWSNNLDVYWDGVGIPSSKLSNVVLTVKADKLMKMRMEYKKWFNQSSIDENAADSKEFYIPGDGQWHEIGFETTFNQEYRGNNVCQIKLIPQAVSAENNTYDGTEITADGNYYIKSVELIGTYNRTDSYKYEATEPVLYRGNTSCRVAMPSLINYSGKHMKVGFLAASYDNGIMSDVKFTIKDIAAGRVSPSFETEVSVASENSEVKTFMWEWDSMKPINTNELYDDTLPVRTEDVDYVIPDVTVEPDDSDFEGKTKVLVLGNSYTRHEPAIIYTNGQRVVWSGKWGMAASAQENDYVHLLRSYAKEKNDAVGFKIKTIYNLESNPANYRTELENLKEYRDFDADIVVLAIGTNMGTEDVPYAKEAYSALIDYVNPTGDAEVICAMLLGVGDAVKYEMYKVANEKGCTWIDLTDKNGGEYLATEIYGENGVGWHYGDNGMKMVADNIWNGRNYISNDISSAEGGNAVNVQFKGLKDLIPAPSLE